MTNEMTKTASDCIEEAQTDIEGIAAILRIMSTLNDDELPCAEVITDAVFFLARELERLSEEHLTPAWHAVVKSEVLAQERRAHNNRQEGS